MSFQLPSRSVAAIDAEQRRKLNEDAANRYVPTRTADDADAPSRVSLTAKIRQLARRIRSR